jgi:TatD DNase family protein
VTELVDSHAHLQEAEFEGDRDDVVRRAGAAGVPWVVVPGVDAATSEAARRLAERHAGVVFAAGYHPHEARHCDAAAVAAVRELLSHPGAVAVGEIGLDYYRMHSPREEQLAALETMLRLAAETGKPVIIHCREAHDDLLPLLTAWSHSQGGGIDGRPLGVMHYYSGDTALAESYLNLGFLISVHTSVTHPNSERLRSVAATLPLGGLLLETDSPYGAPQAHRGKRNEPAWIVEAAKAVAQARAMPLEEVASATTANARRLFPTLATAPAMAARASS